MTDLPSITSPEVAATQPHAMVDSDGDVFYPDDREEALSFAEDYGARPVNFLAFMRWWGHDDG